jgi:pimeloyl-ACP methyl ester carboxylesterase
MALISSCASESAGVETSVASDPAFGDMSVWSPSDGGPWPTVFLLHGLDGDRADVETLGRELAAEGHVVFAPTWRLGAETAVQLTCGYRFVPTVAADYGGDPDGPVTVVGHSGGASFAIGGALFDIPIGPDEECFQPVPATVLAVAIAPCTFEEDLSVAGNKDATILVVSGSEDTVCDPAQQRTTVERLAGAGYDARLITIEGANHWTPVFRDLEQNTVVERPDSVDGRETVRIITEAIADLTG